MNIGHIQAISSKMIHLRNMNKKRSFLLSSILTSYFVFFAFLFLPLSVVRAQNVAHFTDKLQRFWVFDAGQFHRLEHLPVAKVQQGGNYVIYEDQLHQVKEYRGGKTRIIDYMPVSDSFRVEQQLMASHLLGALRVYSDQETDILTLTATLPQPFTYALGDSILAFIDYDRYLKAYYHGELYDISVQDMREYRTSDNSVAYLTEGETLNVYCPPNNHEIDTALPNEYQVGNNGMVGYINRFNELWVFDQNDHQQLSPVRPQSWAMGTNLLAWVDINGVFKCYSQGRIEELSSVAPKQYAITDSILSYTDNRGFFNVFYRGKNYVLETYQPSQIEQGGGIVAYTDLDNRVYAFYEGEQVRVSPQIVHRFALMGRCIVYSFNQSGTNNGDTEIYWNKQTYAP